MTQREKDEKLVDLMKISIRAEEVVQLYQPVSTTVEMGEAIMALGDLLEAYNKRWGEEES